MQKRIMRMRIPVVALRGLTVLPKMLMHFDVSREKSVAAVERAMVLDQKIFMVTQKEEQCSDPQLEDLYALGTVGTIKQLLKLPNHVVRVLVEGEERAELLDLTGREPFLEAEVEYIPVEQTEYTSTEREAMIRALQSEIEQFGKADPNFGETAARQLLTIQTLEELLSQLMIRFPMEAAERQKFLNLDSTYMQYMVLCDMLEREIEISRMKTEIQSKVKARVDKNQKEYLLREQMKVIREELGEDDLESDVDHYLEKMEKLKASTEIKEKIRKEISRLKIMPSGSQEGTVSRSYIETLLEMPWQKVSRESRDIHKAEEILNKEHYGMEKIKERILEYLAVRMFAGNNNGSILCLVGPPGTGKTSIAQSVAHALDKKYVRVCLGGVKDEAEIRGHRRTYIGAMPGRIANGMKQAGVANPLMLLDEIDKVSSDYKGDTSSALLEVLDSEQNNRFVDHYVELPMDLSKVMFIATANSVSTIPRPLLDRMEVIEVSSYTENEKFHIAHDYLLEKQRKKNGLKPEQIDITDDALRMVIHRYTREAGVRNLERRIGDLCRKAAREILEKEVKKVTVEENTLEKYLGKPKVHFDMANEKDDVGIVRGLAWTSVGGDTLQIEVNSLPGTGKVQLTGQMGDVMKESAQTGISYIRSVADKYRVDAEYFEKHDIHIHIPEGAVPKDGPSAGITMATAMLSAITNIKVKADLAMTGEITLRGRVLPIGGLKEKLLAAKMAGIHLVLVPARNQVDVEELSAEITDGLEIKYVSSMDEVLSYSFVKEKTEE
ncbi:MAG: endopeptidase La [Clostridiales bacterium]|nr:endopeptidase La [Clostridiales bacterium]